MKHSPLFKRSRTFLWCTLFASLASAACGGGGGDATSDGGGDATSDGGGTRARPGTIDTSFGEGGRLMNATAYVGIIGGGDGSSLLLSGSNLTRLMPSGVVDPGFSTGDRRYTSAAYVADGLWYVTGNGSQNASQNVPFVDKFSAEPFEYLGTWGASPSSGFFVDIIANQTGGGVVLDTKRVFQRLPSGDPDTDFGIDGIASTPSSPDLFYAAIKRAPDGSLIVMAQQSHAPYALRFTSTGELDTTFGDEGFVRFSALSPRGARAFEIDAQGRVLMLGVSGRTPMLVRTTTDGAYDATFGEGGHLSIYTGHADQETRAICFDDSGRIYIGVDTGGDNIGSGVAIVRMTNDGTLDTTFGDDGVVDVEMSVGEAKGGLSLRRAMLVRGERLLLVGKTGHGEGTVDSPVSISGAVVALHI